MIAVFEFLAFLVLFFYVLEKTEVAQSKLPIDKILSVLQTEQSVASPCSGSYCIMHTICNVTINHSLKLI
jgi:hypothetical protein